MLHDLAIKLSTSGSCDDRAARWRLGLNDRIVSLCDDYRRRGKYSSISEYRQSDTCFQVRQVHRLVGRGTPGRNRTLFVSGGGVAARLKHAIPTYNHASRTVLHTTPLHRQISLKSAQ